MSTSENPKLSKVERVILKNQYAILEFLTRAHPEFAQIGNVIYHDADFYHRAQTILEYGYEYLLSEITEGIHDIDLSLEDQREILDILDMYSDLQWSFEELTDKAGLTESDVNFPGWDGNSPKGELSFARLFCYRGLDQYSRTDAKPDRFENVRPSPAYNGHGPFLPGYRRMLKVFLPFKSNLASNRWRPFTAVEIRNILDAFPHPDGTRDAETRSRKGGN